MNERVSFFDLTALPFELYRRKHHVFLASFEKTKRLTIISNPAHE
jgi:hypothetical protein